MHTDYGQHFMGFGGGFMWFFWPILIALVIWAVIVLAKSDRGSGTPTSREILDQRYANGEIDSDTYEQMKRKLE